MVDAEPGLGRLVAELQGVAVDEQWPSKIGDKAVDERSWHRA